MRAWMLRHRTPIIAVYIAFIVTLSFILQILENRGVI